MAKLKLPFELEKPSASEFVTQASQIGYGGSSLDKSVAGLSQDIYNLQSGVGGLTSEVNAKTNNINNNVNTISTAHNTNASALEAKVNALISLITDIVPKIVFHKGTPINISATLNNLMSLTRVNLTSIPDSGGSEEPTVYTGAICGKAICGQAILGTN